MPLARNNCRRESLLASPVSVGKENHNPQLPLMPPKVQLEKKAQLWLPICNELQCRTQEVIDAAKKLIAEDKSDMNSESIFSTIVKKLYITSDRGRQVR